MRLILLRQHNRVAEQLGKINPHWDDEALFQTARTITIGMIQHIFVNELFPVYIGKRLFPRIVGNGKIKEVDLEYDPRINPGATAEFIHSAFRQGHSMIAGRLE